MFCKQRSLLMLQQDGTAAEAPAPLVRPAASGGGAARPGGTLTVGVALLPDAVHPAVGVDAQEEAAVLAVEPLGVLEVPGGEGSAAPVVGQRWQRGDAPRRRCRHASGPGGAPPPRAPAVPCRQLRAASSPAPAVQPRLPAARPKPCPAGPARRRLRCGAVCSRPVRRSCATALPAGERRAGRESRAHRGRAPRRHRAAPVAAPPPPAPAPRRGPLPAAGAAGGRGACLGRPEGQSGAGWLRGTRGALRAPCGAGR